MISVEAFDADQRPPRAVRPKDALLVEPAPAILYIVHDTADAAVKRRVKMLEAGGARVHLAGFRRTPNCPPGVSDFGQTHPAKLAQRAGSVLRVSLTHRSYADIAQSCDVILCRNLESLVIGWLLQRSSSPRPRLVYESLDIHRALLGMGLPSRLLRRLERALAASCSLLLTSSPAFVRYYFESRNALGIPVRVVENKVFPHDPGATQAVQLGRPRHQRQGTITIGWFGVIRCRRSLAILDGLANCMQGRLKVIIRGQVARHEFDDFDATVKANPHLTYEGPYRNPDDLASIYQAVDFTWAIDFFEEGLNSAWLLPNRLYEGCLHGAVPIALDHVETGRWLAARDIGVTLADTDPSAIASVLDSIWPDGLEALKSAVARLPARTWMATEEDCLELVGSLLGREVGSMSPGTSTR